MIICEIGLNHLGKIDYAEEYVNKIIESKPDGITFYVGDENFYSNPKFSNYKLPDNFYYLSSKSKINTYFLLDILDYCVTVRGTVGIEAAMRGKEVITAGTGRYENKGFTNNFMDLEEYQHTISNLHKFKSNLTRVEELANKFAYISLICKNYSPRNFSFFYTHDLRSKLQVIQNDNQSVDENNDSELVKWLSNLEEDYFKDPLNQWIR